MPAWATIAAILADLADIKVTVIADDAMIVSVVLRELFVARVAFEIRVVFVVIIIIVT